MNVMKYYENEVSKNGKDYEVAALQTLYHFHQNITMKERAAIGTLLTNVRGIRDGYTSIMKVLDILVG